MEATGIEPVTPCLSSKYSTAELCLRMQNRIIKRNEAVNELFRRVSINRDCPLGQSLRLSFRRFPLSNSLPEGERAIIPSPASGRELGRGSPESSGIKNHHEVEHIRGFACFAGSFLLLDSGLRRNDGLMDNLGSSDSMTSLMGCGSGITCYAC